LGAKIGDARSLPPVAPENLREKVWGFVWDGKKQVEVAKLLGVPRQAIKKWVKKYWEGEKRSLARNGGKKSKGDRFGERRVKELTTER